MVKNAQIMFYFIFKGAKNENSEYEDEKEKEEKNEEEKREKEKESKSSSTKYVPPALRKLQAKGDDEKLKMERLKKQLKGLLNRFVVDFLEWTFVLKFMIFSWKRCILWNIVFCYFAINLDPNFCASFLLRVIHYYHLTFVQGE